MIFDLIKTSVTETQDRSVLIAAYCEKHRPAIVAVARELGKLEDKMIRITVTTESIDLQIAGDRHVLKAIFGAFRRVGYLPDDRPRAKTEPSFSTYFRHPDHDCKFWISFTSSQCSRVKVGSEMQRVDIYETVCE